MNTKPILNGNLTGKQIRQFLAGHESKTVISDNNVFQLVHIIDYRGWFDDAFFVSQFRIVDKRTEQCLYFDQLNKALIAWDGCNQATPEKLN